MSDNKKIPNLTFSVGANTKLTAKTIRGEISVYERGLLVRFNKPVTDKDIFSVFGKCHYKVLSYIHNTGSGKITIKDIIILGWVV